MPNDITTNLFKDIKNLIESARTRISREFSVTHVMLNWHIGNRTNHEILKSERAEYGQKIISNLSNQLQSEYGRGYDKTSISRMIKFAKLFPDQKIVATLSQQLSWSQVIQLIAIPDELKRNFYAEMCRLESWDVRTLKNKINSMLFERTALSKKPEHLIQQEIDHLRNTNALTPSVIFHDPYFLDFIGLKEDYSETDLENAILNELTKFLQEFGNDFCFLARQKRMVTENKDRYLDLLFFHRGLHRLIAIELKIGAFEPSHKGQMEWYLNWLDKHEKKPGEDKPLGIILCANKDQGDVEYLELDASGIHVAQYLTQLPPREILEERLIKAIEIAREKYEHLQLMKKED